jgi:hypothetical protein
MTNKMNRILMFVGTLAVAAIATATLVHADADMEKNEVKSLIESAYLNGAFNDLDTASMKMGFHPVFKIHGVKEGELMAYPIADWIESIEKKKASPDYTPKKWDYKFAYVDVTGIAASAKIELSKDGKHVYTDYLSLLKFEDGWKITDKVYYRHADSE